MNAKILLGVLGFLAIVGKFFICDWTLESFFTEKIKKLFEKEKVNEERKRESVQPLTLIYPIQHWQTFSFSAFINCGGPVCTKHEQDFEDFLSNFKSDLDDNLKQCDKDLSKIKKDELDEFESLDDDKKKNFNKKPHKNKFDASIHECRHIFEDAIYEGCINLALEYEIEPEEVLKLAQGEESLYSGVHPISCFAQNIPKLKDDCDKAAEDFEEIVRKYEDN